MKRISQIQMNTTSPLKIMILATTLLTSALGMAQPFHLHDVESLMKECKKDTGPSNLDYGNPNIDPRLFGYGEGQNLHYCAVDAEKSQSSMTNLTLIKDTCSVEIMNNKYAYYNGLVGGVATFQQRASVDECVAQKYQQILIASGQSEAALKAKEVEYKADFSYTRSPISSTFKPAVTVFCNQDDEAKSMCNYTWTNELERQVIVGLRLICLNSLATAHPLIKASNLNENAFAELIKADKLRAAQYLATCNLESVLSSLNTDSQLWDLSKLPSPNY